MSTATDVEKEKATVKYVVYTAIGTFLGGAALLHYQHDMEKQWRAEEERRARVEAEVREEVDRHREAKKSAPAAPKKNIPVGDLLKADPPKERVPVKMMCEPGRDVPLRELVQAQPRANVTQMF